PSSMMTKSGYQNLAKLAQTIAASLWRASPKSTRGGVAFDPVDQQLALGRRVGAQRGPAVDLGSEDVGGRWGDDPELRSSHFRVLRYFPIWMSILPASSLTCRYRRSLLSIRSHQRARAKPAGP